MPYVPKTLTPAIVARPSATCPHEVGHVGDASVLRSQGCITLSCNGEPYSPSEYRELAAAIGDEFGWKDGRPLLPDARGTAIGSMAVPPKR
jgi:hypothetical protein